MSFAPVLVPTQFDDPGRNNKCWPSQPIATAEFDRDKLKCYYKCMCFCSADDVVSRTFLDLYTNGIMVNIPMACCCCCVKDNVRFIYYDAKLFRRDPTGGGICSPYPYWCPHCCNCFGNTLIFQPGCGCPTGGLHAEGYNICCPIDILYGLTDGQGDRLAGLIREAKTKFENAGKVVPKPVVGHHAGGMHMGAHDAGNLNTGML